MSRRRNPIRTSCRAREKTVRAVVLAAFVACALVPAASAFDLPADSVLSLGGRIDLRLDTARGSRPFPWNYASRSLADRSRLMLDLFAGRETYGQLYLKAEALWAEPRADTGEIRVRFEQGDYLWDYAQPSLGLDLRLYANERRYWTGELSGTLLDDDAVDLLYEDHYGLRHDGAAGDFRWSATGAVLGDTWDRAEKFYHVRGGWFGSVVQLSASYLNSSPAVDTLENHAVFKGELSALYRRAGFVAGYAVSGDGDSPLFFPSGEGDGTTGPWPDNSSTLAPRAGAVYMEARLSRIALGGTGLWSFVGRYDAAGDEYAGGYGRPHGGETRGRAAVYYAAAGVCVDGSIEYDYLRRTRVDDRADHRIVAGAQGLLTNGGQLLLRGAWGETEDAFGSLTKTNFLHAGIRRHGRTVYSALHVMTADFGGATRQRDDRLGVEARFNLVPGLSLYGRFILSQQVASRDAAYWRFEMWPTENVFVTFGYGRAWIGDEPFLVEDADIGSRPGTEPVYFATVRGDF